MHWVLSAAASITLVPSPESGACSISRCKVGWKLPSAGALGEAGAPVQNFDCVEHDGGVVGAEGRVGTGGMVEGSGEVGGSVVKVG